jgi:hypothetical protein
VLRHPVGQGEHQVRLAADPHLRVQVALRPQTEVALLLLGPVGRLLLAVADLPPLGLVAYRRRSKKWTKNTSQCVLACLQHA